MAEDQEWCLECGTARTVIARPPDWRVPALVIGVVALLVVGGFIYALTQLGSSAGRVTVVTPASTVTTSTTSTTLAGWPPGLDGWTVILASTGTRAAADADARRLLSRAPGVGVLATSQHPQMGHPGRWDIFVGRYSSAALAQAAALTARRTGHPGATEALVQTPGG